jgi:hypothetical protein
MLARDKRSTLFRLTISDEGKKSDWHQGAFILDTIMNLALEEDSQGPML